MRWFAIDLLRVLALDLPVYRELFARLGGACLALLRNGAINSYEGRLRGLTYHQPVGGGPYFVGRGVTFVGRARITLGEDTRLYGWSYLDTGRNGFIRIAAHTRIDVYSVLYGQGGLSIGNSCALASGVIIYTQSNQYDVEPAKRIIDQPIKYAPVSIGDDVWIGARVTILPGVTIGDRAVIGAGALVREDVASGVVVVGVPAREVGRRC